MSSNRPSTALLPHTPEKKQPGRSPTGFCCVYSEILPSVSLCCMVAKLSLTLCDPTDCSPTRLRCSWDSPGKNTGVGCQALLQGVFPTQGLNSCVLHWPADTLPLSCLGRTMEVFLYCRFLLFSRSVVSDSL